MGKYEKDAKILLEGVGGKENIQSVTHCVTRLRFVLADEKKADVKSIKKLNVVKGTFTQSGQFQVIIGNEVQAFYQDLMAVMGNVSEQAITEEKTSQTKLQKMMGILGEIFAPLIPAIICGGLVLGLETWLDGIFFLEGFAQFLRLIGSTIFSFLPVGIIWSITKKMGTTQILGIVLGLTMIAAQGQLTDFASWQIGNFYFETVQATSQISAAIFAGFVLAYLEKFWRKVSPEALSILIVPLCSLIPAVIVTQLAAVPLGQWLDYGIAVLTVQVLTSSWGWLASGLIGGLYAPVVITGLHHITNMIDLQMISYFQGTLLWPLLALSNIAQGSAVLAMRVLQRKDPAAKKSNGSACLSCYLGVTEPAMFGVNLKYQFPFVCAMIGAGIASAYAGAQQVMAMSIGMGGLPAILSIQPQHALSYAVAIFLAMAVTFVLTYLAGSKILSKEAEKPTFLSPLCGRVLTLTEVADQVFSAGLMGEGFAVDITDGKVTAPFDGEIVMTFPTKHAYGIKSADGLEVLIHIGMDTVALNGEGFECLVHIGDHVSMGDVIAHVDLETIRKHGKSLVSPVVLTSHQHVALKPVQTICCQEPIIEILSGGE